MLFVAPSNNVKAQKATGCWVVDALKPALSIKDVDTLLNKLVLFLAFSMV